MMQRFTTHSGIVTPFDRDNIDTDQIIPARFLHRPRDQGYGDVLFADLRDGNGSPFETASFDTATILATGCNFGCGSSREHAVWALLDHGVRVVIASGFGDIFFNNALQNGLLPVVLPAEQAQAILREASERPGTIMSVDLGSQKISTPRAEYSFSIDSYRKEAIMLGLSETQMTLREEAAIAEFERRHFTENAWAFETSRSARTDNP